MLVEFLLSLFSDGELVFQAPPAPTDRSDAVRVLKSAFEVCGLEIAGPRVEFDCEAAVTAAEFVCSTCWFLVHRDSDAAEVERRLKCPHPPKTVGQHLSADLTFRYLPMLHRRAAVLSPDDVLTRRLIEVLRVYPLSGVLAQLDEPPTTPPEFCGHYGLELLYAERFVQLPRESWRPAGRVGEMIELVKG